VRGARACVAKERESARVPEARSNRTESSCATAQLRGEGRGVSD
jgi:hypothetical protein